MVLMDPPDHAGSAIGDVRREIVETAQDIGFSERIVAELEIVGTELATNLIHHDALDGAMLVSTLGDKQGIEIVAVDRGPGIVDIDAALRDHSSTTGSLGCGLGAVRRLTDEFDIYSEPISGEAFDRNKMPPGGTVVMTRKWLEGSAPPGRFQIGLVSTPCQGEVANGDAVHIHEDDQGLLVAVADGLGHGPSAEIASQTCMAYIKKSGGKDIQALMAELHDALRGTNGVALTLVRIVPDQQRLVHCGVGNVSVRSWPNLEASLIPRPGILGSGRPTKLKVHKIPWTRDATLLIHTDGVSDRWTLEDVADLAAHHAGTICHYLANRFAKPTDDSAIVVIREKP